MSALGAALASIGISKDSIIEFETALKPDKFLLVVRGTTEEVFIASEVLHNGGYHVAYSCHGEKVMVR